MMVYLLISNILCFFLPLFLTFKLLNGVYQKRHAINDRNNDQVKFLLNYWICFIAMDYVEKWVLHNDIFWPLHGLGYFPNHFSSTIKIWLFYNHGCLVINYCYFDILWGRIICALGPLGSKESLELKFINPAMKRLLAENYLALLKSISNKTESQILGKIIQFSEDFAKSSDKSFLQFSLDNICYMDSEQDLKRNFEITKEFFGSLMTFVQNQMVLFNIQDGLAAPILRVLQFLLVSSIPNDGSQNKLEHKSKNRVEKLLMDPNNKKRNILAVKELDYKSRNEHLVQKCTIDRRLLPRYTENYHLGIYSKGKLKMLSSKSEYLDNAIRGHFPSTISNPFQLKKCR